MIYILYIGVCVYVSACVCVCVCVCGISGTSDYFILIPHYDNSNDLHSSL